MKSLAFVIAAGALLAIGAASAATAADVSAARDDVSSIVIRYRTLDLQDSQGAGALAARITDAARTICGAEPRYISLRHAKYAACVHDVAGKAVRQVDAPLLTAAYQGDGQRLRLTQR